MTVLSLGEPGVDFPAFQPGPLDAEAGLQDHELALSAVIPVGAAPDTDWWVLQLTFAAGHGPCPDLIIDIDGEHRSLWHPAVQRHDRSEVSRHGPIAGEVALDIPLPAEWLPSGEHTITITTTLDRPAAIGPLDLPAEPFQQHRAQFGHHFGSGITWHAARLEHGALPPRSPAVELVPSPLYVQNGEGHLAELVDLTVTVPAGVPWPASARVSVGEWTHDVDLARSAREFGQVRVRTPVPEFATNTTARVALSDGTVATVNISPARKWTIHFIPHVHLDVGYTDTQGKVLELHSRNLDRALAALDQDDSFAFSIDGSMIVAQYLATRSEKQSQRVLGALRSRRLAVNAFHNLFLSGIASLEEIYRAAYLAATLRDQYGVPIDYANLTDVPSYSAAVPSTLNALGIDAFVGIENHDRGGNADSDEQHLTSPVMWEGVDGSRVLAHFSDTYSQLRFMAGDPQTIEGGAQAFTRLLARYDRDDYLPNALAVIGTHADNEDLADGDASFAARWNAAYAYPRMTVSTMAGYLDAIRPLADHLPVWRGDGGSYWEDGVGTAAAVIAEHRQAQVALLAAESIAALVARCDETYRTNRDVLDAAWDSLLYGSEHTWTWSHATAHPHGEQVGDQLDWKRHQVHMAYRTAVDETRRALSQLGEIVTTDGPTLLVYNPLGHQRDIDVEVEATRGTPFVIGGRTLDVEELTECNNLVRHRLTVPDVPGFGYRTLQLAATPTLSPGEEGRAPHAGKHTGEYNKTGDITEHPHLPSVSDGIGDWLPLRRQITTTRWRLTLEPTTGAIQALTHRPSGRQILDIDSPWHLGQVLYVVNGPDSLTRGDHPPAHSGTPHTHPPAPRSTLAGRRPVAPAPELTVTPAEMRPIGIRRTYDGWRLRTVGSGPTLPGVEVDVLLRDADDRVDVQVRVTKERELTKEALYVAFPFSATKPRVHYDRQQGWINPAVDHVPGACHEWFTTQHGVAVEESPGGPAIIWTSADAPLFTVDDIVRGTWPEKFDPQTGGIFSWVMNNYWPTNTPPEQDGTLTLRYAFAPVDSFDPVIASRFGREVRTAALIGDVTLLDKFDTNPRPLPAGGQSLLDMELPPEIHASVAESRDRTGVLVRLQNLSGRSVTAQLPVAAVGDHVVRCRADETQITTLPGNSDNVPVAIQPWEVVSLLISETQVR